MKFNITLTWSKLMALLVLVAGVWMAIKFNDLSPFTYALPIVMALIMGKQGQQLIESIKKTKT